MAENEILLVDEDEIDLPVSNEDQVFDTTALTAINIAKQPDWNETDTESLAYIKNKPTKVSDFTNDGDGESQFATQEWVQQNYIEQKWLSYTTSDWVADGEYYKIEIPYATHGFLNAYVEAVKIINSEDNSEENALFAYKLLANDTMVVRADAVVNCKILIKGDI